MGTEPGTIQIFSLPELSSLATANRSEGGSINAVAFSSDGRVLASGGAGCQVTLWDALMGVELLKLPRQESTIVGLAFEPAGMRLAICGVEEQITVWDVDMVLDQLKRLGIAWDWPAAKQTPSREEAVWPEMLIQRWLRQTNGSTSDGLAASSLAMLLAQDPRKGVDERAAIESLSRRGMDWTPEEADVWRLRAEVLASNGDWAAALAVCDRAVEELPNNAAFWNMKGACLVKRNRRDEARRAFTRAIDLAGADAERTREVLSEALSNRSSLLRQMGLFREAGLDHCRAKSIPGRAPQTGTNLVDLSLFYNAGFRPNWHGDADGNDLAELPVGVQKLAGVEFDLRGLIQLGRSWPEQSFAYPSVVSGISVNQVCQRLHFLHAAILANRAGNGTSIGRYVVHYGDGQNHKIPIVMGQDLAGWWEEEAEIGACTVAWRGTNEKARAANMHIHLFKRTWENPRANVVIRSLDFESTHNQGYPFLVAITVGSGETPEYWLQTAKETEAQGEVDEALATLDKAIKTSPRSPSLWIAKAKLLQKTVHRDDALEEAFSQAIELASADTNAFGSARKELLVDRSSLLKKMNRIEEATADNLAAHGIPPRDPKTKPSLIDLSLHYNLGLTEAPGWYADNTLAPLAAGTQTLGGTEFDVRGTIQLGASQPPVHEFPAQVSGIAVGQRGRRLHFFHGTTTSAAPGIPIAFLAIHCAGGQTYEQPIRYGTDVEDWWDQSTATKATNSALTTSSTPVWRGQNPANKRLNTWLRLYKMTWENPQPDVEIKTIDFRSTKTACAPFLIAITVE